MYANNVEDLPSTVIQNTIASFTIRDVPYT